MTDCPCPYSFCSCRPGRRWSFCCRGRLWCSCCHGQHWYCCCHGRRWCCCRRGRRWCCCCRGRHWCCSCMSVRLVNRVWISTMTELSNSTKQVLKPNHFFVQTWTLLIGTVSVRGPNAQWKSRCIAGFCKFKMHQSCSFPLNSMRQNV